MVMMMIMMIIMDGCKDVSYNFNFFSVIKTFH